MTAYADFAYYTETYFGTVIAETDFPRLALQASASLDAMTFNRAASVTDEADLDKLKMATCAVAEEINTIALDGGDDGVVSERVGTHAVTYRRGASKQMTHDQRYLAAASVYLTSTELLFRGFATDEYGTG